MLKTVIFLVLFLLYLVYGIVVYTSGTRAAVRLPAQEASLVDKGKALFQQYNCTACHQLYGLGGYLGPELTTAYSDPSRGEAYMRVFLKSGGPRMPNFNFTDHEILALIHYLKYVDSTATTYKMNRRP